MVALSPVGGQQPLGRNGATYTGANSQPATGSSFADILSQRAAVGVQLSRHAQKRVDQVVTEEKSTLDEARRDAAKLSLWLTAALLFGAFAASLTAVEGGMLRDGAWNERVLVPRAL